MSRSVPCRSSATQTSGPGRGLGLSLGATWCLLLLLGAVCGSTTNLLRCPAVPNIRTTVTESNTSMTFVNGTLTSANVTDLAVNGTDRLIVCADNPLGMAHECHRHRDCFHKLSKAFNCCRGPCHNECVHYTKLRPARSKGKEAGEKAEKPQAVPKPEEEDKEGEKKVKGYKESAHHGHKHGVETVYLTG